MDFYTYTRQALYPFYDLKKPIGVLFPLSLVTTFLKKTDNIYIPQNFTTNILKFLSNFFPAYKLLFTKDLTTFYTAYIQYNETSLECYFENKSPENLNIFYYVLILTEDIIFPFIDLRTLFLDARFSNIPNLVYLKQLVIDERNQKLIFIFEVENTTLQYHFITSYPLTSDQELTSITLKNFIPIEDIPHLLVCSKEINELIKFITTYKTFLYRSTSYILYFQNLYVHPLQCSFKIPNISIQNNSQNLSLLTKNLNIQTDSLLTFYAKEKNTLSLNLEIPPSECLILAEDGVYSINGISSKNGNLLLKAKEPLQLIEEPSTSTIYIKLQLDDISSELCG